MTMGEMVASLREMCGPGPAVDLLRLSAEDAAAAADRFPVTVYVIHGGSRVAYVSNDLVPFPHSTARTAAVACEHARNRPVAARPRLSKPA